MARRLTVSAITTSGTAVNTDGLSLSLVMPATATPVPVLYSRPRIYDLIVAANGSPNDNTLNWLLRRVTAAPTAPASPVSPVRIDLNDAVGQLLPYPNATQGSWSDTVLEFAVNQRSTFRWVATPGGEIVIPAVLSNGVGLTVSSTPGVSIGNRVSIYWME